MKFVMDPNPSAPSESSTVGWLPPPYVDERLVAPETREEIVRGRRTHAPGASPAHGDRHNQLNRVIGTCVARGYTVSTRLLTRAGPRSDFATDTCVRRSGVDPRTGSRYLEELAFEVVDDESSMLETVERAEDLTSCGVRRLIAIVADRSKICEWSPATKRWLPFDPNDVLEDATLICPVPLRAFFDQTEANNTMVDALAAKGCGGLTAGST